MQSHVGVSPAKAGQQWRHKAAEGDQRIAAEGAEKEVEPDNVWLQPVQHSQNAECARGIVERPAAQYIEPLGLRGIGPKLIGEDSEAKEWIPIQLLRNVKTILAQSPRTWGKSRDQTNLHSPFASWWLNGSMNVAGEMLATNACSTVSVIGAGSAPLES
jgi:hypothetical protein